MSTLILAFYRFFQASVRNSDDRWGQQTTSVTPASATAAAAHDDATTTTTTTVSTGTNSGIDRQIDIEKDIFD